MRKILILWWKIIKQYLSNCNIHGARYLVNDQLSYPERFFWLVACFLCWIGCTVMIKDVVINYIHYPVSLTTETMYVDWNTPFPAIAICIPSTKEIENDYFKWNPGLLSNDSSPKLLQASTEDLLTVYDKMKVPCAELLAACTWNDVRFDCCSEFKELKRTGVGHCIAMNTYHLTDNGRPSVHLFVNRSVKYGDLVIDIPVNSRTKFLLTTLNVLVLNNVRLPTITNLKKEIHIKPGKITRVEFIMQDTFNEDGVRSVAIEHRNCRFLHEMRENRQFDIYSSDSCYLEAIIERMLKFCGCVHFYYFTPRAARTCNGTEVLCIIGNSTRILSEVTMDEECLSNCEGTSLILYEIYENYASVHLWKIYRGLVAKNYITILFWMH